MSDEYLPGVMVLARSLRDSGTKKQLAVLVTMNALQVSTIDELKRIYDFIIPVDQIVNKSPANLYLMNRPDLGSTFTKIALWRQMQFQKIVYVDADMVALRAPDELFDQPSSFAAVPDIGWPDCFNSGLLVLSPNMGDYYGLLALAQRGISFDGADQGLLNMHFRDWHRLSFTYNCTPSGNYQYVPAYRHFQSSISMVHFIGTDKPWRVGRDWKEATGVYEELMGRWWAVYDKYYRAPAVAFASGQSQPESSIVQQYVEGEASTTDFGFSSIPHPPFEQEKKPEAPVDTTEMPLTEKPEPAEALEQGEIKPMPTTQQRRFSVDWDPMHHPPPPNSKPEASNFPSQTYEMSTDRKLFQPPAEYPEPPKNMHYQVPPTPPSVERPKPIFPWEEKQAKPTRVFPDEPRPSSSESAPSITTDTSTQAETASPVTPTIQVTPSEPFTFSRTNAWDEMPEIERYIANLPQNRRRAQLQVLLRKKSADTTGSEATLSSSTEVPPTDSPQRRPSLRLTDFPTEIERPSLPVTPAPVRRPSFWGQERDEAGDLPAAEGVPDQSQWDPMAKLLELQRRQSEMLNAGPPSPRREIPDRALPESSTPLPSEEPKTPSRVSAPAQVEEAQAAHTPAAPPYATPEVEVTKTEPVKSAEQQTEKGKEPESQGD
ncbi:MAG: hypothetical protein LQ338_005496 [Usnochroma carphineum]|nr:MAG: hypothetical protein LQ338_005496 [Usnochroma carphineum]